MNLKATAYHEAGHAVVAFLQFFKIEFATIKPAGEAAGMVKSMARGKVDPDIATPAMRAKIEALIIVTLAGDIAQRKHQAKSVRRWHASADRQQAADLALSICGSGESATAYLAWLDIVTRNIVEGRWSVIERVAAALLERETLTGDELRAVILGPIAAKTECGTAKG
ncbi:MULTISPECIES: hypothetical protein [unclassified Mesorhizobium]|uniref:hypothetical protein n=1 Tax=unclassified Mesorhizobium TaxID=325217 RepID=UPI000FCC1676|nr:MULTISPECIES: hypothetical protein [unclassified Mesorhizobium]RUW01101.1 hypothetical protein EOA49_12350 [Mesorhizobium sp. M1A.F.Ca.IN.020.04.1.1]RUW09398.1 hypothetical protein EOA53_16740 [Mesorhizobium sp. M1A.F.Ca.IN.020.03.1.1]RWF75491.1 MAG: hypothetical protein EOQ34_01640 [Mesorhizobium sp.]RWG16719.1 MAG: hypothetical protein EOQ58_07310 [Mesorhizobium sp.]RWG33436.1 MAG: hypothetical protein EOQ61_08330 [Mesorhizobium sp.]